MPLYYVSDNPALECGSRLGAHSELNRSCMWLEIATCNPTRLQSCVTRMAPADGAECRAEPAWSLYVSQKFLLRPPKSWLQSSPNSANRQLRMVPLLPHKWGAAVTLLSTALCARNCNLMFLFYLNKNKKLYMDACYSRHPLAVSARANQPTTCSMMHDGRLVRELDPHPFNRPALNCASSDLATQ